MLGTCGRRSLAALRRRRIGWLNVGLAVLVVPLIAVLGAGLLTRSRLPIERRL